MTDEIPKADVEKRTVTHDGGATVKLKIEVPDLYKNGNVMEKVIGKINTPFGRIKLVTCYRNGEPSFDISDITLEMTDGDDYCNAHLIHGIYTIDGDEFLVPGVTDFAEFAKSFGGFK